MAVVPKRRSSKVYVPDLSRCDDSLLAELSVVGAKMFSQQFTAVFKLSRSFSVPGALDARPTVRKQGGAGASAAASPEVHRCAHGILPSLHPRCSGDHPGPLRDGVSHNISRFCQFHARVLNEQWWDVHGIDLPLGGDDKRRLMVSRYGMRVPFPVDTVPSTLHD